MSGEIIDTDIDGMSGLSRGARLLVWTLRQFIAASGHTTLIAREFSAACGNDAPAVFATFGTFLCMLAYSGRRRVRIGLPGDSGLTEDERLIVNLIGAFQNDNRVLADFYMDRFSRRATRPELRMAVGALATAFAANGLLFPPSAPLLSVVPGGVKDNARGSQARLKGRQNLSDFTATSQATAALRVVWPRTTSQANCI